MTFSSQSADEANTMSTLTANNHRLLLNILPAHVCDYYLKDGGLGGVSRENDMISANTELS